MFDKIIEIVEKVTGFSFEKPVEITENEFLYAKDCDDKIIISGKEKADIARALTLYAKEYKNKNRNFEIKEERLFQKLGVYFDVSRGGVLTVDAIKKYANEILCMGFNRIYLYMEDVFELPGYPHFGYLRGRYSKEELKDISSYGDKIGIEMIPAIQTLGHMSQYLRWNEATPVKDTGAVLLCGSEETYKFIDAMISTLRECFSTENIQIGCDEAFGLGTGKYLKKNGYKDPLDILKEHTVKVCDICKKYDFTPTMFTDTYIRNLNDEHRYYIHNLEIPDNLLCGLPDVKTTYWDYYHLNEEDYDMMIDYHKKMKEIPEFGGGIWTWVGHIPNVGHTFDTMLPAMKSCVKNGIKDVYAALYGDDGTQCTYSMALPLLNIFSEYCFKGEKASFETINEMTKFLYDVDCEDYIKTSEFYYPFVKDLSFPLLSKPNCFGEKVFTADIFYNLTGTYDFSEYIPRHKEAYKIFDGLGKNTKWEKYYKYIALIFDINIIKMELIGNLYKAYKEDNREYLQKAKDEIIPYLVDRYKEVYELHKEQWMSNYKVFGWEETMSRYSHLISRLIYSSEVIESYLSGKQNKIYELEFELIEDTYGGFSFSGFNRFCINRTISNS